MCLFKDTGPTKIYTLSLHDALPFYAQAIVALLFATISLAYLLRGEALLFALAAEAAALHLVARRLSDRVVCCMGHALDRKSTRLNSSHANISYAVFCLKKQTSLLSS